MNRKLSLILVISILVMGCNHSRIKDPQWSLMLNQPGEKEIELVSIPDLSIPVNFQTNLKGILLKFTLEPKSGYSIFKATAISSDEPTSIYFSLKSKYDEKCIPYNFNGEVKSPEIYRQSPHDVNAWITEGIAKQAVPVVALKKDSFFYVALNGSPALYNNFTSQAFYPDDRIIELSSGDNGETPGLKPDTTANVKMNYNTDKTQVMAPGRILSYYHPVSKTNSHVFEGILFKSKATDLNGLRKDVNQLAATHFSGGKYNDYFGALAFTTAYMNLRVNETGKSNYWVVPSVEYANTQYCRDAFWISTMLDPEYSAECLKNELASVNTYAEYPLMAVIWAYRAYKEGQEVNLAKVQAYINSIETRARNNYFYSYTEKDGRLDFQYWGDVIAFDKNDVITYNQGLFALVLSAAKEMGLQIKSDPDKALRQYQNLFNSKLGFYPISKLKNTILGPDPLVPDLLSQLYFNRKLLDDKTVTQHYLQIVNNSKTKYGIKVLSLPNGDYLPAEMYNVKGYISQVNREKDMPDGRYLKGGSYFLYDNLFLIDAYLHGVKEAEDELIERVSLDFKIGATTYECLNTKTGEPWKPNMGWNVAIYSFWRKLVDEGKASNRLFETIDQIVKNKTQK
jgi:hypothetical protein